MSCTDVGEAFHVEAEKTQVDFMAAPLVLAAVVGLFALTCLQPLVVLGLALLTIH